MLSSRKFWHRDENGSIVGPIKNTYVCDNCGAEYESTVLTMVFDLKVACNDCAGHIIDFFKRNKSSEVGTRSKTQKCCENCAGDLPVDGQPNTIFGKTVCDSCYHHIQLFRARNKRTSKELVASAFEPIAEVDPDHINVGSVTAIEQNTPAPLRVHLNDGIAEVRPAERMQANG